MIAFVTLMAAIFVAGAVYLGFVVLVAAFAGAGNRDDQVAQMMADRPHVDVRGLRPYDWASEALRVEREAERHLVGRGGR